MEKTETAAQLRNAAAYLRKHGWIRDWNDGFGATCVMGACALGNGWVDSWSPVGIAIHINSPYWASAVALAEAMGFGSVPRAIGWNDAEARDKEEVIARLEAAACKLEPKEEI